MKPLPTAPFLVAHRAGNHEHLLRGAERLRTGLVEADVRLYHGRLEVRHVKSVGPLPILWDKWYLANPRAPRLLLHELLAMVEPGTQLMLDLKGPRRRLARDVRAALDARPHPGSVTVCARSWRVLEVFAGDPDVRIVRSIGSRRALRRMLAHAGPARIGGISIHARLLDADVVRALSRTAELVMSWPVNSPERARTLLGWGVHGLITDEPELLSRYVVHSCVPHHPEAATA